VKDRMDIHVGLTRWNHGKRPASSREGVAGDRRLGCCERVLEPHFTLPSSIQRDQGGHGGSDGNG
jgi:hypothetical protein